MSYDIDLRIDTGNGLVQVGREWCPTYNLGDMFAEALGRRLPSLHGYRAGDALVILRRAVADMEARPDHFKQFNPPNGWGDYDGALCVLRELAEECAQHPNTLIHIS